MKNYTLLLAFFLLAISNLSAQDEAKYRSQIGEAEKLYDEKAWESSAEKYAEAFVALGNKGYINDRYNAACSYALSNQIDSAFVQLLKIAKGGHYTNYTHLLKDSDLSSLYEDSRWEEVKKHVKANKDKQEENYDKPLVAELELIFDEDQGPRRKIAAIEKEHGWESPQMKELWKEIEVKDSVNLIRVMNILDERGWLGADIIGGKGNQTLFLVIQHAPLEVQEKYLPMMREAVEKGNANARSLALLEDRVALRQGKRQMYGSQIGRDQETGENYVLPLDDPMNVDQRRAEMGLGSLQDYVGRWGITWDPEAYLEELPALEEKQKNK